MKVKIFEEKPVEEKKSGNSRSLLKTAVYFTAISIWIIGTICILAHWQLMPRIPFNLFTDRGFDKGITCVRNRCRDANDNLIKTDNVEHSTSDMNVGDDDYSEYFETTTYEPADYKWDDSTDEPKVNTEVNMNPKDIILEAINRDDAIETKALITRLFNNFDGNTNFIPLTAAAEKCKENVAEMLIENGANVNISDGIGWMPIHVATYNDCENIVEMLIKHGADKNAKVSIGYTPLHIAAHNGRDEIAQLLIDSGADVQIRDSGYSEKTALQWAIYRGHENVVKVLRANEVGHNFSEDPTTESTTFNSSEFDDSDDYIYSYDS